MILKGKINLIAISGAAGSGKSKLSTALQGQFAYLPMSFATTLKNMVYQLPFMGDHEKWKDRVWKEKEHPFYGRSPRHLLQTIGTEWGRNLVHPDIWVWIAAQTVEDKHLITRNHLFVFDDLRFENEAKWVKSVGGICVKVVRPEQQIFVDNPKHASEAGIPATMLDRIIENDSTVEKLMQQASHLHELAEATRQS